MPAELDALKRDVVCRLSAAGSPIHPGDALRALDEDPDAEGALRAALGRDNASFRAALEDAVTRTDGRKADRR